MTTKTPLRFPSSTQSKKSDNSRELTSARIAAHMDAFQESGGTIEVLGTTPVLKHVGQPAAVKTD